MTGRHAPQPRRRWIQRCRRWIQLGALSLLVVPGSFAATADPDAEGLADGCTSCHGIGGHSQGFIPSIAGVSKATLLRELKAFRAQTAQATIMNRIARAYTDPELEALAEYFSARPRP